MSLFKNPFDEKTDLSACPCGAHKSLAAHNAELAMLQQAQQLQTAADEEKRLTNAVDQAVVRALIPDDMTRRRVLHTIGAGTLLAAVEQFFPLATAREVFAQDKGPLERRISRSASSPSPAPRRSSWRIRWASMPSMA